MGKDLVAELKKRIRAAVDVLDNAIAFHEAWKPTATNASLHQQMGRSFATNTFLSIRAALRRQTLITLMQLWERNDNGVHLLDFLTVLKEPSVQEALIDDKLNRWRTVRQGIDDVSIIQTFQPSEFELAVLEASLRQNLVDATTSLQKYEPENAGGVLLKKIKSLRDKRLAHHDLTDGAGNFDETDQAIETFYQDTFEVVQKLLSAVAGISYSPEETATMRQRHAELFWASVCGEKTPGHPDYKLIPRRNENAS